MADYIMDLRKIVGHRPLILVGASVLLEDSQGRILLQKRQDDHRWCYHGGCLELDEEVEAAARRELWEETGLTAGEMTLFGIFSGKEMRYSYPNGDQVSLVDIVYLCRDYTGALCPQPSEVEALRFFEADSLPEDLSGGVLPVLRKWAKSKGVCL